MYAMGWGGIFLHHLDFYILQGLNHNCLRSLKTIIHLKIIFLY